MAIAKRAGARKAKVALARKLAVVLHRMLMDGTPFAAEAVGRATMAGCGLRGGNTATTAAIGHQPLERSPSPGRWNRPGRIPPSGAPQPATAPS